MAYLYSYNVNLTIYLVCDNFILISFLYPVGAENNPVQHEKNCTRLPGNQGTVVCPSHYWQFFETGIWLCI